jgi:hypothetical protein
MSHTNKKLAQPKNFCIIINMVNNNGAPFMQNVYGYTSKASAIRAVNAIINPMGHNLLSVLGNPEGNMKLAKSNITTYPFNVMPADSSGITNSCPDATPQCKKLCLHTAGNAAFLPVKIKGRMARTYAMVYARKAMFAAIVWDIHNKLKNASEELAFRLNTTSDYRWEKLPVEIDGVKTTIIEHFSTVQFYDYTKSEARARMSITPDSGWPHNYHLTLSLSELNDVAAAEHLQAGGNVAACVKYTKIPSEMTLNGISFFTFNADKSDMRFKDPKGLIGVLYPKGRAKDAEFENGFTRVV